MKSKRLGFDSSSTELSKASQTPPNVVSLVQNKETNKYEANMAPRVTNQDGLMVKRVRDDRYVILRWVGRGAHQEDQGYTQYV
jgi:hypothetical protein